MVGDKVSKSKKKEVFSIFLDPHDINMFTITTFLLKENYCVSKDSCDQGCAINRNLMVMAINFFNCNRNTTEKFIAINLMFHKILNFLLHSFCIFSMVAQC